MACLTRGVFIVAAKRTPFGTFGGQLKDTSATELARIASMAALEQASLSPDVVDSVVVGNVSPLSSKNGPYIARHVGLSVGVKIETPCLLVNRLCGSGFQSVITGAQQICLNESKIVLASGTENMSQYPFVLRDTRFGVKFTKTPTIECSLWSTLTDWHINTPMGVTAENLAKKYRLTREEVDKFALMSQTRWKEANGAGRFKQETTPIKLVKRKKEFIMDTDEHPQDTNMETLAKLRPSFEKDGVCTAGNSSGIADGGGAIVLASEESINQHGLKPLARVVGYSMIGCDPTIMGIGPVMAIKRVCDANGLSLEKDIGLVDINEAFGAQVLAVVRELNLDLNKLNVNGGAVAFGHALAATNVRCLSHLVYEMERRQVKYSIASCCVGGGQGVAIVIERLS